MYRLQEIKAPSGYSRLAEEIYFVFMKKDKDTTIKDMNSIFSAVNVSTDKIKFYETTNKDAILYVPNDNTEITVKKVWENKDGSILVNPPTDSIQVTVYRQKQQLAKWTVTINKDGHLTPYEVAKGSHFIISFPSWGIENYTNETKEKFVKMSDGNYQLRIEQVNSENAPYYYIVKETVTIPGYRTTYLNNGGIQTGIIYITNQKEEEQSITLPETGGTGTYWYTMGGVLLTAGAAFLIYKKHMRKGDKRIW